MAFRRRKHSSEQEFPSNETSAKEGSGNRDDVEQAPSTSQRTSFQFALSSKSQLSTPNIEYKFDIASRLDDSVAIKLVNAPNRSPDLIPLTKSFDAMRKRLRQLISSAKQYHKSMNVLDMDRLQVSQRHTFSYFSFTHFLTSVDFQCTDGKRNVSLCRGLAN